MSIVYNDIFIFDNVISISLKVPSVYGKLKWQKIVFQKGHLRFLSNFPFVNLQIKSIVESFTSHNVVHSIDEKISELLKNMHFWVKNRFFKKFSNFSESVGRILLTPLAFWKLLIGTSCLSCLDIISNEPCT